MRMPSRIQSGAHEYRIRRTAAPTLNRKRVVAVCDTDRLDIQVEKGLKLSRAQQKLLHELCHTTTTNISVPIEHEELIVEAISEGLLPILQDNPQLVAYLTRKDKRTEPRGSQAV